MVETIVILMALAAGLLAMMMRLPPLVGFLAAGFALPTMQQNFSQMEPTNFTPLANIGVTLLLFSIGLKLDLRTLLRPFVWGVTCLHMALTVFFLSGLLLVLKTIGWSLLSDLTTVQCVTIGFALSFSSTIFAVKVLEGHGEIASMHGKAAIGILVMQDIIAVAYLSIAGDKTPLLYAPLVLLLIPLRPVINQVLVRCGHTELLVLAGFALAFGGASLFELVQLKGDLGALFIGAVIAGYDKAKELAKVLLNFKDLMLIGFFLGVGQLGMPSGEAWLMALLLIAVLMLKPLLYFLLLTRFNLRTQTALFSALTLNNYSEFGLIVMALSVQQGWLPAEWMVVVALALSLSFVLGAAASEYGYALYSRFHRSLARFQTDRRISEQRPVDIGDADILVMGMGRVGSGAYDYLRDVYGDKVVGFEEDAAKAARHVAKGRVVQVGDASDRELWQRMPKKQINQIMLALSNHSETVMVAKILRERGYTGAIAAVAKYQDDQDELVALDVIAFNFYAEVGAGFAEHVHNHLAN